ncbi:ABC transporter permease [Thalassobacillus sp. CUG 92003]|uniref:ABC transporter permease n=1 Tax=Thalassobacillus sp. CUG 92003 TaxID=2736641 RepID=UPI0015E72E81|nr:ABC transporter permease [Thalassobacillus sp. CUG 92003]
MANPLFNQTWKLSRFILRRDRFKLPIWLLSLTGITILIAESFTGLYPTDESRESIAQTMVNPAMTAMVGPGYGLDNYTIGAMMAHQMLLFTAITVAIMSILIVANHTRADEEDGNLEMIRALPTGRLSNLSATIVVLLGVNVVLAMASGLGLYALGIESMDLQGSLLYGAALGATGFFFTSVTALFAQLSESSRGTIGLSFTVLGVAYFLRAIGDVSNEAFSWASPLGWILGTEVYVNNYWWPIVLTCGVSVLFILIALYLSSIRDLGAGFLPSKPGKKNASPFLQSPLGLALRLQRTGLISWAVGMVFLGVSYGSVFGDLDSFFNDMEVMEEFLSPVAGVSITEQFTAKLMSIISMICTIPALMVLFKLKGEEKKNRVEHLLGRAVSRTRLLGSYFVISLITGFVMLSLAALGLGSVALSVMDSSMSLGTFYSSAMVYMPAMAVMIGIAALLVGFLPNITGFTWLYLGYSFFVVYLGGMFQFEEWVGNMSPFAHVPQLPVQEMEWGSTSALIVIAVALIVAGFAGYNKRDIQG